MPDPSIASDVAAEFAAIGRFAAERGWVPATAGNFSRRLDASHVAITRSGTDKGALRASDLAVVRLDGPLPEGISAEAPLHLARYRADRNIGAIVHVHSLAATVLSRLERDRPAIEVEGFEMQKALSGVTTHEGTVRIALFPNAQDTEALAQTVEAGLRNVDDAAPGYLLAGHGLYAWGESMGVAGRHAEALDFLLRCALEQRRMR